MSDDIEIEQTIIEDVHPKTQAIVVMDGSDIPLVLADNMDSSEIADLVPNPLQRRIIAARLRFWADQFEALAGASS